MSKVRRSWYAEHDIEKRGIYPFTTTTPAPTTEPFLTITVVWEIAFIDYPICLDRLEPFSDQIQINIFIGPQSDHRLCLSLTHSLTDSLLFSKLD